MILTIQKEQFTKTKIGPSEKQPFTYYTKRNARKTTWVCSMWIWSTKFKIWTWCYKPIKSPSQIFKIPCKTDQRLPPAHGRKSCTERMPRLPLYLHWLKVSAREAEHDPAGCARNNYHHKTDSNKTTRCMRKLTTLFIQESPETLSTVAKTVVKWFHWSHDTRL